METKVCKKCGEEKKTSDFSTVLNKGRKLDKPYIRNTCKKCITAARNPETLSKYLERNKDRISQRRKDYVKKNAEKVSQNYKEWRLKNRDRLIAKKRDWSKDNSKHCLEYRKKWQAENRELHLSTRKKNYNKYISELRPVYVKAILREQGFPKESITPELIEVKSLIIKTQRLCRTSKN